MGNARSIGRVLGLCLLYLAIVVALLVMYGQDDFSTPSYVYQAF